MLLERLEDPKCRLEKLKLVLCSLCTNDVFALTEMFIRVLHFLWNNPIFYLPLKYSLPFHSLTKEVKYPEEIFLFGPTSWASVMIV